MYQTFKLCNMRDCHSHDVEPVPFDAVDPCGVFWHSESNMWYDELTGSVVPMHQHGDGTTFDIQAWLLGQAQKAMATWKWGDKVHETYKRHEIPASGSKLPATAPKYTNEELDHLTDQFIRNASAGDAYLLESIGKEIQAYTRMQKKWNNHPMVEERLSTLRAQRKAIMAAQSVVNKTGNVAKKHMQDDKKWTDRWAARKGEWEEYTLIWEDAKSKVLWCIDRNGLKIRGHYLYLPETDQSFIESANYAEEQFGIPKSAWKKLWVATERIGSSIKRYGKKNANGARINALFDQKKYAECCLIMVKQMKELGIDVDAFHKDPALKEQYLNNVLPKLQRQ